MDLNAEITSHLKELHMPTVRELFEPTAQTARDSSLGYEEYLFELISEEIQTRRQNRVQRLLRQSYLALEKNFECFDLSRLAEVVNKNETTQLIN